MSSLYFSADWIIDPTMVSYLQEHGFGNTLSLKYRLVTTYRKSEEGYHLLHLTVSVPSEADLQQFIDRVASKIGLNVWKPTSEAEFLEGDDLSYHGEGYLLDMAFDSIRESGHDNQILQKQIEQANQKVDPNEYDLPFRD